MEPWLEFLLILLATEKIDPLESSLVKSENRRNSLLDREKPLEEIRLIVQHQNLLDLSVKDIGLFLDENAQILVLAQFGEKSWVLSPILLHLHFEVKFCLRSFLV